MNGDITRVILEVSNNPEVTHSPDGSVTFTFDSDDALLDFHVRKNGTVAVCVIDRQNCRSNTSEYDLRPYGRYIDRLPTAVRLCVEAMAVMLWSDMHKDKTPVDIGRMATEMFGEEVYKAAIEFFQTRKGESEVFSMAKVEADGRHNGIV